MAKKEKITIVKTKKVLYDDQGRPHSWTEPAFQMEDGWGVYIIHGIPIGSTDTQEEGKNEMNETEENGRMADRTYLITGMQYGKPKKLTIQDIHNERNTEFRRIMIQKYGMKEFLLESNAKVLDEDVVELVLEDGTKVKHKRKLLQMKFEAGENTVENTIIGVLVTNSTPNGTYPQMEYTWKPLKEFSQISQRKIMRDYDNTDHIKVDKDGTVLVKTVKENGEFIPELDAKGNYIFKDYFLPCDPQLRPTDIDDATGRVLWQGEPQKPTIKNAIASTFGLTGEEYAPEEET